LRLEPLEERWLLDGAAAVIGRYVFYNRSAWDGGDPAADARDDLAVATDKQALLPGQMAAFANYTGYSRGINGIMIDIAGAANASQLSAADFQFKAGNDRLSGAWSDAPPGSVTVRPGQGAGGADRVTIIWPDNVIQNQWLQAMVLADAHTGLPKPDVFYFGNAIGESGNSGADAIVSQPDEDLVRASKTGLVPTAITDRYDFDRNRLVNVADVLIARDHQTSPAGALQLIRAGTYYFPANQNEIAFVRNNTQFQDGDVVLLPSGTWTCGDLRPSIFGSGKTVTIKGPASGSAPCVLKGRWKATANGNTLVASDFTAT
jgi:hypothetical protein